MRYLIKVRFSQRFGKLALPRIVTDALGPQLYSNDGEMRRGKGFLSFGRAAALYFFGAWASWSIVSLWQRIQLVVRCLLLSCLF